MSLETNLTNFATRVGTEARALRTLINGNTGDLSGLTTTAKANLVAAINEVVQEIDTIQSGGVATDLESLTDVDLTSPADGHILVHDGVQFVNILGTSIYEVAGATSSLQSSLSPVATSGDAADLTGTLPASVLPPLAVNEVFVVASQAEMLSLTAQRGDIAIRTDNARTYILSTDSPSTLVDWMEVTATGDVTSVAGKTGAVTLTKGDVGLSNVDNTSDMNKPVSTATQTALNGKQDSDATLTAIGGLTTSANQFIMATGSDTFVMFNTGTLGRAILADATAADARTELDVYSKSEIGNPETDLVAVFNSALV